MKSETHEFLFYYVLNCRSIFLSEIKYCNEQLLLFLRSRGNRYIWHQRCGSLRGVLAGGIQECKKNLNLSDKAGQKLGSPGVTGDTGTGSMDSIADLVWQPELLERDDGSLFPSRVMEHTPPQMAPLATLEALNVDDDDVPTWSLGYN